jgi:hypothetical protein
LPPAWSWGSCCSRPPCSSSPTGRGRRRLALATAFAALCACGPASASPRIQYGVKDDAWLAFGPGTLEQRVRVLDKLGVSVVRYTLPWPEIALRRPRYPRWYASHAYTWGSADRVLKALHKHRIDTVLGISGSPGWANGGRGPNVAPRSARFIGDFAHAAARRYPWIRRWLIWNEPNQRIWLRPTTPSTYVKRLLNPAYAALHREIPNARVAGGVTAPRGNTGGVSPVSWIRGMGKAKAHLDAYAHHPYPLKPRVETPTSQGCTWRK